MKTSYFCPLGVFNLLFSTKGLLAYRGGWFYNLISNKNAKGNEIIDLLNSKSFFSLFFSFSCSLDYLESLNRLSGEIWCWILQPLRIYKIKAHCWESMLLDSFYNHFFVRSLNIKLMKFALEEDERSIKRDKSSLVLRVLTTLILECIIITNWCFCRADWCIKSFSRQHLIWKFSVANVHHFYNHYPSLLSIFAAIDWHIFFNM